MLTLGIETSCDETSASVVKDGVEILSNKIASSLQLHKQYGGVVPEIACRHHLECIDYVIKDALEAASADLSKIELIAVTYGPGLAGALLIGISSAKALGLALKIPLIGVNHLYAHIYSCMLKGNIKFPCIGLVVSGGHTTLALIKNYNDLTLLGQTRDDAAGEAFDKAAKILGLGYPGGPIVEEKAKSGNPDAVDFPMAFLEKGSFDFSFSGVKTALLYYIRKQSQGKKQVNINDICASFQKAIFYVIVDKAVNAAKGTNAAQLLVGGGVSVNRTLQQMFIDRAKGDCIQVLFPETGLGTDNAAMVAAAGYRLYKEGLRSDYSLEAEPNLNIGDGSHPSVRNVP
ncbi:MAG: tRNA (adenosine(37)-N6)-threonylcarbamoyltransferase complex transferase subunit TsaD [Candidatus Omnitrophota bacterium]